MNRIKKISVSLMLLFMSLVVFSQEENREDIYLIKKNSINLTAGGSGLFLSFNYEKYFFIKTNYYLSASVGIGFIPISGGVTIPHMITYNWGKKSNFLELGLGGTYWSGTRNNTDKQESVNSYNLSPVIGWKKHFKKNMILRIYTNPLINVFGENYIEDLTVMPYLGISLGYTF